MSNNTISNKIARRAKGQSNLFSKIKQLKLIGKISCSFSKQQEYTWSVFNTVNVNLFCVNRTNIFLFCITINMPMADYVMIYPEKKKKKKKKKRDRIKEPKQ